ncbi:hypothetical protein ABBQ32_007917 [Trebouxia sp. C0010 RCD-2024]
MSLHIAEQSFCQHCSLGRVPTAIKPARAGSNRHQNWPAKCIAASSASSSVRVTKFPDGSVTYHFSEEADRQVDVELLQQPNSALGLISPQQDSFSSNGAAAEVLQHQEAGTDTASRTAGSAVLSDLRQQSSTQQEPGQNGGASPSWSVNLEWDRDISPVSASDSTAIKQKVVRKLRQAAKKTNGNHADAQIAQPAEPYSNLDSKLDFDNGDTHMLLRAYNSRVAAGRLHAALGVLEILVAAGRTDVLKRIRHKDFLRPAKDHKAVSHAMRFVQLLPSHLTDARTYNMLVSVCIAARDLPMALKAGAMLKDSGKQLDTFLYTNLITACAMEGDADTGFRLYEDMLSDRVPTDPRVYTALISVCSGKIRLSESDSSRRDQLVLLERAFGVFHDMQEARVKPDAAVWNALIGAAGRAGQLQRAMEALRDMQDHYQKPDGHTFASLLHACRQAGDQPLALKVYSNALDAGCTHSLIIYDAAISACQNPVDLDTAMQIYADMQRYGVKPDERLYSSLMEVAGRAQRVTLAFDLQADMLEQGLQPSQVSYCTLIMVCIDNQQLEEAGEVHRLCIQAGLQPDAYAYNALINAYGCGLQFGKAVSLVQDMVRGGLQPDQFTFTAILNACQRANEAEVAFEVFRLMQQHKIMVDDAVCFVLLRLCFNRLREEWYPGGYPPTAGQAMHRHPGETSPAGRRLLQVLSGKTEAPELPENVNWVSRAMMVYRQGLSHGLRPSLKVLDRLLSCLRLPFIPPLAPGLSSHAPPPQHKGGQAGRGTAQHAELAQQEGNDSAFDPSVVTILEEAIALGIVPPFRLDLPCAVDMRQMPPSVAEVYVLTMATALKRASQAKAYTGAPQPITLLVQPFDPAQVYFPSYAQDAFNSQNRGPGQQSLQSYDEEEQAMLDKLLPSTLTTSVADPPTSSASAGPEDTSSSPATPSNSTALGVVGMLRRLKLWTEGDASNGKLTILPSSIAAWLRSTGRAAANVRSQAPMHQQQWIGQSIADQQRQLRSGHVSRNAKYSGRGRSQNGRGQQHNTPNPIIWNELHSNSRKYEDLDFDE